jgi:hypothetical protein
VSFLFILRKVFIFYNYLLKLTNWKFSGVIMKENEPENCWDYMECPNYIKEKCDAYIRDFGKECWMVAKDTGTGCYGYKKYDGCRNCPWFIKNSVKT